MTAMVYIFLADLQCAKWMPSSLCVSRISLSSSRSSHLYLILSYIVDSLTFIARICDRCKFSSSRALESQRGGQDTIRTSWRNENALIASDLCQKLLQVPRMGLDVREIRRAFRDNKQLAFRLLHQDRYSYLLSPKAVSGIRPVVRGGWPA